ncbi:ABC transporter permease [Microbacterium invictum]|uniref:ABC transporter permease n=1 Tax=Microbacterium invictum TaxID=515415 RepID=A0ABZ0VB74_9MICO|nr:ABC transporter permease [Microbacterium invictum]WQB70885.1 ABC transporter permease [Microbacterium invictum]
MSTTRASHKVSFGPSRTIRLGLRRIAFEVRAYFRQGDSVFFTFLFPVLFLFIFAVAFSSSTFGPPTDEVTAAGYYLPAMLAAGLLLSGTQLLAIDIAMERSDGTLKRLGGMPLSPVSYFIGKLGQVLVTGVFQAALLLVIAAVFFGVALPTDPERWLTFTWVFLLGAITCGVLGIALSALPRSGRSATAVVIPIVLVLQFISGVFIPFDTLPEWLQNFAGIFPLKWIAQGMRSVFLPEVFADAEPGGSWQHPETLIALLIWLVVGLILARLTFRWIRKDG